MPGNPIKEDDVPKFIQQTLVQTIIPKETKYAGRPISSIIFNLWWCLITKKPLEEVNLFFNEQAKVEGTSRVSVQYTIMNNESRILVIEYDNPAHLSYSLDEVYFYKNFLYGATKGADKPEGH